MTGLCKYKHLFGVEGQGIHSIRFLNIAIVDLIATIALALSIAYYFHVNFIIVFLTLIAIAIVVHRLFCVNTTLNVLLIGQV